MKTQYQNRNEQHSGPPASLYSESQYETLRTVAAPRCAPRQLIPQQIRATVEAACAAHGGITYMHLDDWRQVEKGFLPLLWQSRSSS
jgi:hypothetical protein